ncbi:macrophage migration inhibitory factor-like protein [Leptomonas pyrrhocoris]|uniref:Macrophage migration inhibitory factor-like protein n=1 Tax=Leptomonas pyrrhocoris TaxID=157538 RepID=A0A0M9G336_LEPPY|nr:macrophage migration inhibitory factor-like protein [Leptomonas pyrrhocoris]KPA81156.1 macrophage migration inhibitory factor-like protein [Leptomonas pyrrhocoris]|eukprot:XP_015659595.1 macrophage migration inhibitory factor-like protein [Leptomonas pyrrhocoris]
MPSTDLRTSRRPVLFQKVSHHGAAQKNAKQQRSTQLLNSLFVLDRYLSNLVRALVHPLHNFLQCHHGLHNADEVQVMLMPKDGPVAAADRAVESDLTSSTPRKVTNSSTLRRCYVATNNETLSEASLRNAVQDWGVAGVFQISEFVLVRGAKGQHAEQKLLEYLRTCILSTTVLHVNDAALTADQKALVVGERLPCVACRLFAIPYEDVSVLLPSHGHMYLSTISPSLMALKASITTTEKSKDVVRCAYGNPIVAAKLLLAAGHRRVLR